MQSVESTFVGLFKPDANETQRITFDEMAVQFAGDKPPVILDVRSRGHYENDDGQIPGSIRVISDQIDLWATTASKDRIIVAYCLVQIKRRVDAFHDKHWDFRHRR